MNMAPSKAIKAPPAGDIATSLVKALDLLSALSHEPDGISVRGLVDRFQQPRSSLVRIAQTLVAYGLVEKADGVYRVTEGFRDWASADGSLSLRRRFRPVLEDLSRELGELVVLGVIDGKKVRFVDYIESPSAVRVSPDPLKRHALPLTAMGKLYLSVRPDLVRELGLSARQRGEIVDAARDGLAWNRGGTDPDLVVLALWAAGTNPSSPMIGVSWPAFRFTEAKGQSAIRQIRKILQAHQTL